MPDLVGHTLLGRYRVTHFLGRGGMAEVYRAWDTKRATDVAIKLLNDDLAADAVFLRRFAREGRTLARLMHPNVIRFLGFEQAPGLAFMVMEFIDGITLRRFMGLLRRPLTIAQTLGVLQPVASALHYAHQMATFHLDIKPANIFIERGGRVVLGDFGIARMSESATMTLSSIGTPAYMSPEQAPGGQPIDGRSDIYSLAITTYEMLTTDRPFKGETGSTSASLAERILWEHLNVSPPPPRTINPQIPPAVETGLMRALAKDPAWRHPHVLEFYEELRRGAGVQPVRITPEMVEVRAAAASVSPPAAAQPRPRPRPLPSGAAGGKPTRKPRLGLFAGLAAAVVIVAIVVAYALGPWGKPAATLTPTSLRAVETVAAQTETPQNGDGAVQPSATAAPTAAPATPVPVATAAPSDVNVLYVLDAAEGMQTYLGSQTKLNAARSAIVDNLLHVQATGRPVNAGLLVFGHRIRDPRDDGYCDEPNVEVQLPVLAGSAGRIRDLLAGLSSQHGGAPLGVAVSQAFGEFRFTTDRTNAVILIAGATSYCGEDPLGPIRRNAEVGQELAIYVVGLGISDPAQRQVLISIAEQTSGAYRDASGASDLVQALAEFVDQVRQ
jgi:hypothetical protein